MFSYMLFLQTILDTIQMRRPLLLFALLLLVSCSGQEPDVGGSIITVSIAPYKYFVEAIAGDDFKINVMVPAGSNPHIYEPFPDQISKLRRSVAYISNGYLGFEVTWLDRFYETNRGMKRLSLADGIEPLESEHRHEGEHVEGADPHYWVSPKCALVMAGSVRDFLCRLKPEHKEKYNVNYQKFASDISGLDKKTTELFKGFKGRQFMIYHPNLGYLARDYNLSEVPVEFEGKEPPPSRMRLLIDMAREKGMRTIFVQKEYDTKNARAIADETGAKIKIIDPLSENWLKATSDIIDALYLSFTEDLKGEK
jgi:zinc transport system substrate-binding protein